MSSTHPSLLRRKIIHVDMDAYYASVEILDNPALRGKPLVVGGPPNSRSVVCTASYEARKFGVRSAMPCSRAARLCPQAIFLPPRFERYAEISARIREIFQRYTPLIEPLSLDEAYLDVTDHAQGRYASTIARLIKEAIRQETGLTCSAGVAPNKLLAKIASDFQKPAGLTVVTPDMAEAFMTPLDLRRIPGVGPVTEARLKELGLVRCADLKAWGKERALRELGNLGEWLWDASHGLDERPVETEWERKSLGQEETFPRDLSHQDEVVAEVGRIAFSVADSLKSEGLLGRTITLKIKYADFQQVTRAKTLDLPTDDAAVITATALELLKKTEVPTRPIRLAGVSAGKLEVRS
jgi:DNA polymerase-4